MTALAEVASQSSRNHNRTSHPGPLAQLNMFCTFQTDSTKSLPDVTEPRRQRWLHWQRVPVRAAEGNRRHTKLPPRPRPAASDWKQTFSACSVTSHSWNSPTGKHLQSIVSGASCKRCHKCCTFVSCVTCHGACTQLESHFLCTT